MDSACFFCFVLDKYDLRRPEVDHVSFEKSRWQLSNLRPLLDEIEACVTDDQIVFLMFISRSS